MRPSPDRKGRRLLFAMSALTLTCLVLFGVVVARSLRSRKTHTAAAPEQPPEAAAGPREFTETGRQIEEALEREQVRAAPRPPRLGLEYARAKGAIADCWNKMRCPPGTTCWLGTGGRLGCFASNCSSVVGAANDCAKGQTCEVIDRARGVRRCVDAGPVLENGHCLDSEYAPRDASCAAGLVCVQRYCRNACRANTDCPNGACVKLNDRDRACVQSCQSDSECQPTGHVCVALEPGAPKVCVNRAPQTKDAACEPAAANGCGPGRRCDSALEHDNLLSRCRTECDGPGGCAAGSLCYRAEGAPRGVCIQPCTQGSHSCPAGELCALVDKGPPEAWGCRFAPGAERPAVNASRGEGRFDDPSAEPVPL